MIKASGPENVILGLSDKNIERMKAGDPIKFDGKEIGVPGRTFYIIYGETEQALVDDLRKAGILKV